jgi:hypothetical protein
MKKEPSLFVVDKEIVIDLDKICYMKGRWVRFETSAHSVEFTPSQAEKILAAWIAYKGKFDPSKER